MVVGGGGNILLLVNAKVVENVHCSDQLDCSVNAPAPILTVTVRRHRNFAKQMSHEKQRQMCLLCSLTSASLSIRFVKLRHDAYDQDSDFLHRNVNSR